MWMTLSLKFITRQPRSTAVLTATVAFGILGVLIFEAFRTGIMRDYKDRFVFGVMGNGQLFAKGYYEAPPNPPHKGWIHDTESLRQTLRQGPGVVDAFPRMRFTSFITRGGANLVAVGQGVDGPRESSFFTSLPLLEGTLLQDQADGIVLGEGLAKGLKVKVGDQVTVLAQTIDGQINGADLRVAGVFRSGFANVDDVLYFLPLPVAQEILRTDKAESFAIGLKDMDGWDAFASWYQTLGLDHEILPFEEMDKVYYQNSIQFLQNQFHMMLAIFAILTALGVFNFMSNRIHARRRELGMRKANGESMPTMLRYLTTEALLIGCLGSVAGILLAILFTQVLFPKGILMPPAPGALHYYYAKLHLAPARVAIIAIFGPITALLGSMPAIIWVLRRPTTALLNAAS